VLPRKLRCQAEYAQRANLWSDLAVLARTVRIVFLRQRATG